MDVERWIETWRGPLTGLLAGWGAPWGEAAELAQDALVEAYLGRERLRGDLGDVAVAGPWLRGIARNLWLVRRRHALRRREETLAAEPPQAAHDEDPRLDALRAAMASLPERHRVVLYLFYLEESSAREVAALLGITEKAVEGRLHKARAALRARLATEEQPS